MSKVLKKLTLSILGSAISILCMLFISKIGTEPNDYLSILTNFVIGNFFFLSYLIYNELKED